jgi:copper(I)-binding protein
MTITNATGQDDRVVSAETSVAAMVELHETIQQDGVMSMVHQPEGFLLPAGELLELKPGGKHVMLMGLANPLEPGQTYQLTLNLEKAGPIVVDVTVSGQ